MKCLFCVEEEVLKHSGIIHRCGNCKTSYFILKDILVCWQFSVPYKDNTIWVTWDADESTIIIRLYVPLDSSDSSKIVAVLDESSHITPNNILSKLPTILTFS